MNSVRDIRERFQNDTFARMLGIELVELSPGFAKVAMIVSSNMLNFLSTGHGGAIFTLADTAVALAANSRGEKAVALTITINYVAPANPGEKLIATAREQYVTRRTGVYDVTVVNRLNRAIAALRATAFYPGQAGSR